MDESELTINCSSRFFIFLQLSSNTGKLAFKKEQDNKAQQLSLAAAQPSVGLKQEWKSDFYFAFISHFKGDPISVVTSIC